MEIFLNGAYQGLDFLSFQENSWKPSPGAGSRAENVCKVLNHYRIIKEVVQRLLSDTCPRFLAGILKAGKSELEKQGEPNSFSPLIPGASTLVFEFSTLYQPFQTHKKKLEGEMFGFRSIS